MSDEDELKSERISEAEHAVMEALWDAQPADRRRRLRRASAPRATGRCRRSRRCSARLVAKGAVATEPDGRRFLYTPLLERADYVGSESKRLVDRLFGGRAAPLFAHLAETEALTRRGHRRDRSSAEGAAAMTLAARHARLHRRADRARAARCAARWRAISARARPTRCGCCRCCACVLPPIVLPAWLAPEPAPSAPSCGRVDRARAWRRSHRRPLRRRRRRRRSTGPPLIARRSGSPARRFTSAWRVASYFRGCGASCWRRRAPVGEAGKVRLVETPATASPLAFGRARQGRRAAARLHGAGPTARARDLAIAHELAHHRAHDLAVNFCALPLFALHWFNPLAVARLAGDAARPGSRLRRARDRALRPPRPRAPTPR